MSNYLKTISHRLAYLGDIKRGEIQILVEKLQNDGFGIVYEDKYIKVVRDPVMFPNSVEGGYVRILNQSESEGTGGSVVVPIIEDKVVFVRLFRHATRSWEIELPRGFQAQGISEEASVNKEIQEELGVSTSAVQRLGEINSNTGLLASNIGVYVVQLDQYPDMNASANDPEVHSRKLASIAGIDRFLKEESVRCSISLAAIYLAKMQGRLS